MTFDYGEITLSVAEMRQLLAEHEDCEEIVIEGGSDCGEEFVALHIGGQSFES